MTDTLQTFVAHYYSDHPKADHTLIDNAVDFVNKQTDEHTQAIAMGATLAILHAEAPLIAAALAYPSACSISHTAVSRSSLAPATQKIIRGAQNFSLIEQQALETQASSEENNDKLRKLLLAMVGDVRIVLLKLTEQLVIVDSLKSAPKNVQKECASRISGIYAPLASRLGIGQLKWQLEDWAFRFDNPAAYNEIKQSLNMKRGERDAFVTQMINKLSDLLDDAHIKHKDITGRAKHIYSIHKKLQKKDIAFDKLNDAIALRILLPTIKDCYAILSLIHNRWDHLPEEFDDYIANPKPNGYQSIHTAIKTSEGRVVEVQMRTFTMHESAELGVAAHWAYKEGKNASTSFDSKLKNLRQMMAWQQDINVSDNDNVDTRDLFSDRIYVFTPKGDIIDLCQGATPLDFAYTIHSDVGHRCRGAKVNGVLVTLTHQLQTGDCIDVQTAAEPKPSRDWMNPALGYLASKRAINKVAYWFRQQHHAKHMEAGLAAWEKARRSKNYSREQLKAILGDFNFKSLDALFAAIGANDISMQAVLSHIRQYEHKKEHTFQAAISTPTIIPNKPVAMAKSDVVVEKVDDLLSTLARCCKPIPGDNISGFITKGRGITIHQSSCPNMQHSLLKSPERVVQVDWGERSSRHYAVDLTITATTHAGILHAITQTVGAMKLTLAGLQMSTKKDAQTQIITLTTDTVTVDQLNLLINALSKIEGVINVER